MTKSEMQFLKERVDKTVEIKTVAGERLIARVLFVMHHDGYDEHDVLYEMIATNRPEFYATHANSGGFVLDFADILSGKPHTGETAD